MSRKEQQKKLKGPDQFQVAAMEGVDWMAKNGKQLAALVVIIVAVAGGMAIFKYYKTSQMDARTSELGAIQLQFTKEEEAAQKLRDDIRKQISDINAILTADDKPAEGQAKDDATKKDEAPKKLSPEQEQKIKDLEANLEKIEPDHTTSLGQYKSFYEKYKTTAEGWQAGATAANLLLKDGKSADAKPILEAIPKAAKGVYFYETQTRLTLASVYEDLGEFDAALATLGEVEKVATGDNEMLPQVLLAKGRIFYLKNSPEEAKAMFDKLIEAHTASPEADRARSMALLLN